MSPWCVVSHLGGVVFSEIKTSAGVVFCTNSKRLRSWSGHQPNHHPMCGREPRDVETVEGKALRSLGFV
jgi:hypothetical protein